MAEEKIKDGSTGTAINPDDGATHQCRVVTHDTVTDRLRVVWTDLKHALAPIETWIERNDFKPDRLPPRD